MGFFEIALIVVCCIIVLGVVIKSCIDKKQGKCNCDFCDGNCACCNKYKKEVKKK